MAGRDSGRNPRLQPACSRCQRRKIRCDAQLPSCTNCRKAGTECTDGESLQLRRLVSDGPGGTVSRLRRRVTWFESIIRRRLPDVDLNVENLPEPPEETTVSLVQGNEPSVSIQNENTPMQENGLPPQIVALPDQRAHEIGDRFWADSSQQFELAT